MVVTACYESTDPTIDSQITSPQPADANVLLVAAIPKFAAQATRKVHDLDWKPLFFMSYVSTSVGALATAGFELSRIARACQTPSTLCVIEAVRA
jgi:branched-chain amino acid transport system substrate-binding protein